MDAKGRQNLGVQSVLAPVGKNGRPLRKHLKGIHTVPFVRQVPALLQVCARIPSALGQER